MGIAQSEGSTFSGTTILSNLFSSCPIVPRPPSHRTGNAYFETTFSTLAHGSTHYDFLFQLISKNKIWKALLRFFCCGSLKKNYIKVTAKPPRKSINVLMTDKYNVAIRKFPSFFWNTHWRYLLRSFSWSSMFLSLRRKRERGRDENYWTLIIPEFVRESMRERRSDDEELKIDFVYWSAFLVVQWECYGETG